MRKPAPLTHAPWDNGVILASVREVFPNAPDNKTTKTKCGRRVPVAQAPADRPPTCPDCSAELERERAKDRALIEKLKMIYNI